MGGAIEEGSICVKTTGREAGRKCVVLEATDGKSALVQGPKVRKRKCNTAHLFPTGKVAKVGKGVGVKELRGILEG